MDTFTSPPAPSRCVISSREDSILLRFGKRIRVYEVGVKDLVMDKTVRTLLLTLAQSTVDKNANVVSSLKKVNLCLFMVQFVYEELLVCLKFEENGKGGTNSKHFYAPVSAFMDALDRSEIERLNLVMNNALIHPSKELKLYIHR
ncbi:hypothetical protein BDF20DRAFT_928252 [Mycotypha africana]|uniref:uncharacterized protein n=1 Tax=Mycotypha africana TaxID=64632 RepID=UPI002301D983|nr:uncharacterized protein BDF20DRAFT_928252 [Mycotypha africana]KAI8967395.1 hypothetical protein BDF20DRAFT_928252 [Mycotypha africana]